MPFVTGFERRGMLKLMEDLLRTKFGPEGVELMAAIRELNDAEKYLAVNRVVASATTLEEVRRACIAAAAPPSRGKRKRKRQGPNGSIVGTTEALLTQPRISQVPRRCHVRIADEKSRRQACRSAA